MPRKKMDRRWGDGTEKQLRPFGEKVKTAEYCRGGSKRRKKLSQGRQIYAKKIKDTEKKNKVARQKGRSVDSVKSKVKKSQRRTRAIQLGTE